MNLLAKAARARAILELGTSVGYSTLWLAEAARATGGMVTSVDANPAKHAEARANLEEAGLLPWVELVTGDALAVLDERPGPFELVLLDAWKDAYVPCWEALQGKLAPGALVLADNMTRPESPGTRAYQRRVRETPGYETMTVPIGNGIELTRRLD